MVAASHRPPRLVAALGTALLLGLAATTATTLANAARPVAIAASAATSNKADGGGFIPGGGDWPSGPPGGGGDWPSGPPGGDDADKKKKKKKHRHHGKKHHKKDKDDDEKKGGGTKPGASCSSTRAKEDCVAPCVWCRNKGSPFPGSDGVCLEATKTHDLPPMIYSCEDPKERQVVVAAY